jgi:hypothetical protein
VLKKIPFLPSKEWTANYLHLMRWGWYPGTTEVRRYAPSQAYPMARAAWLDLGDEEDGSPTLQEVINS